MSEIWSSWLKDVVNMALSKGRLTAHEIGNKAPKFGQLREAGIAW